MLQIPLFLRQCDCGKWTRLIHSLWAEGHHWWYSEGFSSRHREIHVLTCNLASACKALWHFSVTTEALHLQTGVMFLKRKAHAQIESEI